MLQEEQIQRYARQVLLRDVGGRGQTRLLEAQVILESAVPGAEIAAAYLVASGVQVLTPDPLAGGFVVDGHWEALSPDQLTERPSARVVRIQTAASSESGALVEVTSSQLRYRTVSACADCWATRSSVPITQAPDVAWGAMVALVAHRLVLDLAEPVGQVTWDGQGFVTTNPRCQAHQTYRVLQPPRP